MIDDNDTLSPIRMGNLPPEAAAKDSDETLVADPRDHMRPTEMVDRQLQRSRGVPTLVSKDARGLLVNRPRAENNRGGDSLNT